MQSQEVVLRENEEYITLNILLKIIGVISTGGMAKIYLQNNFVLVNKEKENRRGRKLYRGDIIEVEGKKITLK